MKTTITGKNIELTQGLKGAVEERFKKLDKYFNKDTEAIVTLIVEKERQKIEVTIPMKGQYLRAEEVTSDMYASIEAVTNTLEAQLKKHRQKIINRQQSNSSAIFASDFLSDEETDEEPIKIIKSKLNTKLEIEGFLLTMFDSRLRLANQIYDEVKRHFQELVFKTVIQRNVKLSESPSHGLPVILYDADSTGAKNHLALANEIILREGK